MSTRSTWSGSVSRSTDGRISLIRRSFPMTSTNRFFLHLEFTDDELEALRELLAEKGGG